MLGSKVTVVYDVGGRASSRAEAVRQELLAALEGDEIKTYFATYRGKSVRSLGGTLVGVKFSDVGDSSDLWSLFAGLRTLQVRVEDSGNDHFPTAGLYHASTLPDAQKRQARGRRRDGPVEVRYRVSGARRADRIGGACPRNRLLRAGAGGQRAGRGQAQLDAGAARAEPRQCAMGLRAASRWQVVAAYYVRRCCAGPPEGAAGAHPLRAGFRRGIARSHTRHTASVSPLVGGPRRRGGFLFALRPLFGILLQI